MEKLNINDTNKSNINIGSPNGPNINVRLKGVEFSNIKNVLNASIDFPIEKNIDKNGRNNIFGIYGPNGSGKTSLINSLGILKSLICEIPFDKKTYNLINVNALESSLTFKFYIDVNDKKYYVEYIVSIEQTNEVVSNNRLLSASVKSETIKYRIENEKDNLKLLISIDLNKNIDKDILKPESAYASLVSDPNIFSSIIKMSVSAKATHKSFLFSNNFINFVKNSPRISSTLREILSQLKMFGMLNFFVVDQVNNNNISLNLGYRHVEVNKAATSFGQININGLITMPKDYFSNYEKSISEANVVLKKIIPGLSIKPANMHDILLPNGAPGIIFQLVSSREGSESIPFSCESNGIRSIFSALSLMIDAYNNPNVCIAVDEFDSGVFEYLLGMIVKVFAESGKGMFIFTSHNLRPLEILSRNNVFFTTKEKYLFGNAKYIPKDFNKRNNYLRIITLHDDAFLQIGPAKEYELKQALRNSANAK